MNKPTCIERQETRVDVERLSKEKEITDNALAMARAHMTLIEASRIHREAAGELQKAKDVFKSAKSQYMRLVEELSKDDTL